MLPTQPGNAETLSLEDKRLALQIVLESDAFARSEQLRSFIRYICEMEFAGHGAELTEYSIGVKALGRPELFSPLEDSSVRTRAYELRQRLQKFYAAEGSNTSVRIELPKGSYLPRFVAGGLPPEPVSMRPNRRIPGWVLGLLGGLLIGGGAVWMLAGRQPSSAIDPLLRQAWQPLIGKGPEVLICLASPLHLLVSPYMAGVPDETPKYPAPPEMYALFGRYRPLPAGAKLEMHAVQKAVTMGEAQGLARVVSILGALGAQYRILPESSSPLTAMRRRNAVLFGSPWFSHSASTVLENTPWYAKLDEESKEIGIFGRGARLGEKYLPKRNPRGEYQEVFGLLTVVPNGESSDNGHTVVSFSGLTSAGSHGAAAFFTTGDKMRVFAARLGQDGHAPLPRSYQVLVRCRTSADAQLLDYEYVAHQVLIP